MYELVYVYDSQFYMFVKSNTKIDDLTRCVVYNSKTETLADEMPIGSWAYRMGPWKEPDDKQMIEGLEIARKLFKE